MTTIKINDIRSEYKEISGRSVNNVLSVIYALMEESKTDKKTLYVLTKVMPASKKQAKTHANAICKFGKVGILKTITRKDGKTYEYEVRPTVDMVLRYFTALYNHAVPEDIIK